MFCIVTVVGVHVLYCDGGICTCFVLWRWYLYMFCIMTVVFVHVLYYDGGPCTCFVLWRLYLYIFLSFDSGTRETSLERADLEVSEILRSNDTALYGKRTQCFNHTAGEAWCRIWLNTLRLFLRGSSVMRHLTTGIRTEECVVRRFRRCANVIECLTQTLKPGNDLASLWMKLLSGIVSRTGRFHPYWRFNLASNFPSHSAYLEFPKILTTVVYAVRRWPKRRYAAHDYFDNPR